MKNIFIKVLLFLMIAVSAQAQNTQPKPSTNVGRAATTQATEVVSIAVFIDSNGRRVARPLLPNEAKKLVRDTQILTQSNGVLNLSGGGGSVVLPTPNLSGYATTTAMNAADAGLQTNINYVQSNFSTALKNALEKYLRADTANVDGAKLEIGEVKTTDFEYAYLSKSGVGFQSRFGALSSFLSLSPQSLSLSVGANGLQFNAYETKIIAGFNNAVRGTSINFTNDVDASNYSSAEAGLIITDGSQSGGTGIFARQIIKDLSNTATGVEIVELVSKADLNRFSYRLVDDSTDPISVLTTDYTVELKGSSDVLLPLSSEITGKLYTLVNSTAASISVNTADPSHDGIIIGATTSDVILLAAYTSVTFQSTGSNWLKVH